MSHNRKIISAVQKMTGTFTEDKVVMYTAEVKSVEGNTCTCYIDDDVELPNCHLQSSVCDGLLFIPVIGSTVTIINSKKNDPVVVQFSDIERAYLQVGDSSIELLNDGSITLNDGSLDGLVKIKDLLTKLNNLESLVNKISTTFDTHTHIAIALGSPTSVPSVPVAQTLIPTKKADIENSKITQGI